MKHTLSVMRTSTTGQLPVRSSSGAIGYDVYADLPFHTEGLLLPSGKRKLISLGFAMVCPPMCYGRLAPRSGLSVKAGIHVMAGVIDPDYRGEVKVLLLNTGSEPVTIRHGDRVAQLILEMAAVLDIEEKETLTDTARGAGGFGSTGI